jgi:hypothetical protein
MYTRLTFASLAALTCLTLSACLGSQPALDTEGDPGTGEAPSALVGVEHVLNRELARPTLRDPALYLVPTFYNGPSGSPQFSVPLNQLLWHGTLSTPNNIPNNGTMSLYVRFLLDAPGASNAAMLSVSPNTAAGLVQTFASLGGTPVTRPSRLSARVMILSGDVRLFAANVNGASLCEVQSTASTPRGVWTTLSRDCPAPASNNPIAMVSLQNATNTGAVALVDSVSLME